MKVLSLGEEGKNSVIFHKYDQKILSLLCSNARLPLSKIAQILHLSRQSVEYRLGVMKKQHLLAGSRAVVNIRKLGYQSYHYFLTIHDSATEKLLIERCAASPFVNTLITYSGKWNYELSLMAPSPGEAHSLFLDLIQGLTLIDYTPCILLKTVKAAVLPGIVPDKAPRLKYIRNDPSFSKQFELPPLPYVPDVTDRRLLYKLSQDAQLPLTTLGKSLRLGRDSVAYRIKKLIRSGYLVEFRPVIDFSALGLSVQTVLLRVNRAQGLDTRFTRYLQERTDVLWAAETFGSWDYIIYLLTKNQMEINDFVEDLHTEFASYLYSYEMLFAYREHKYSFMVPGMLEEK